MRCDDSGMELSQAALPVAVPQARVLTSLGWVLCALAVALTGMAVVFAVGDGVSPEGELALNGVLGLGNGVLGAFVVTRHARHPIGWLFLLTGLVRAVAAAAEAWSRHALLIEPGSLPGGAIASWVTWLFLPTVAAAPMIVVLFPDGRLPGRVWRVVPVLAVVAAALYGVLVPIAMWPHRGPRLLPDAPLPDSTTTHVIGAAISAGSALALIAVVLALISVLVRARREVGDVRQQVKWFGFGAGCGLVLNTVGWISGLDGVQLLGPVAVLTGVGLGIFRFRLYDIDRLINRTLVYGLLTVTLVAAFAAVDIILALIVGHGSTAIAAASAFAAALLLRPVRDQIQELIDRIFDRRTHESVRIFHRLSQRVGHQPIHPGAVRDALRRALHDQTVDVLFRLREPDLLVNVDGAATGPPDAAEPGELGMGRRIEPIRSGDRTMALIVHSRHDPRRVRAVLRAATPVLEHGRLQAELSHQLAEVRASRARLTRAADAERRRIERDLHDGAQQRLIGLALHIQSARRQPSHPPDLADLLDFTVNELRAGIEEIRGLVNGILPPALATGGLPAAVADLARPGRVLVTCEVPRRCPPSVEATAWFVVCEGIANASKYAPGRPVHVAVSTIDNQLLARVTDDGPGGAKPDGEGLRHLADRVQALGGSLRIHSPTGRGTTLVAELPCGS
jgi:signal transduction histidine kinase